MSNPENAATQSTTTGSTDSKNETPNWEDQAKKSDQRYRDTQSAFTKGQQSIKSLEAENAELLKQLGNATQVTISEADQTELDALKYEDPEAWRRKLNSLETSAKQEASANLGELTGKAREAAGQKFELDRRQQVLQTFNESAETEITEELIQNDVPPRITNKLANGEISFEEFLTQVTEYVGKGKVVGNPATTNQPNMGNLGGGNTPTNMKPEKTLSDSYSGDLY